MSSVEKPPAGVWFEETCSGYVDAARVVAGWSDRDLAALQAGERDALDAFECQAAALLGEQAELRDYYTDWAAVRAAVRKYLQGQPESDSDGGSST